MPKMCGVGLGHSVRRRQQGHGRLSQVRRHRTKEGHMTDPVLDEVMRNAAIRERERRHQLAKQRAYRALGKMFPETFAELLAEHKAQLEEENEG